MDVNGCSTFSSVPYDVSTGTTIYVLHAVQQSNGNGILNNRVAHVGFKHF